MQIKLQFNSIGSTEGARLFRGPARFAFHPNDFLCVSVSLMKLLAIRLSSQKTAAKSLVMW